MKYLIKYIWFRNKLFSQCNLNIFVIFHFEIITLTHSIIFCYITGELHIAFCNPVCRFCQWNPNVVSSNLLVKLLVCNNCRSIVFFWFRPSPYGRWWYPYFSSNLIFFFLTIYSQRNSASFSSFVCIPRPVSPQLNGCSLLLCCLVAHLTVSARDIKYILKCLDWKSTLLRKNLEQ